MRKIKLTLAGFIIALIAGLSLTLSQTVLLAEQAIPAGTSTVKGIHKGKHKGKGKGKKQPAKQQKKEKEETGEKTESKSAQTGKD